MPSFKSTQDEVFSSLVSVLTVIPALEGKFYRSACFLSWKWIGLLEHTHSTDTANSTALLNHIIKTEFHTQTKPEWPMFQGVLSTSPPHCHSLPTYNEIGYSTFYMVYYTWQSL